MCSTPVRPSCWRISRPAIFDDCHVDVEDRYQSPGVCDVLHQDPFPRVTEVFIAHPRKRDAEKLRLVSGQAPDRAANWNHRASSRRTGPPEYRAHRFARSCDHQVVFERSRRVAVLVDANLIPGWKALNVGGEQILSRYRNAHAEDRLHE